MDGVIVDFVGGLLRAHDRPNPYDNPDNLGKFEIENLWGISPKAFWQPTDHFEFWNKLDKTPEADEIVELVEGYFGVENIAVLTSPSMHPECVPGKRRWIQRYYPELKNQMIFSSAKKFLAGPQRFLIDDRDKNLEDFARYGGISIRVPRPWNEAYYCVDVVSSIRDFLDKRMNGYAAV
jgi:5'(3')-deoxyribonucleotidase